MRASDLPATARELRSSLHGPRRALAWALGGLGRSRSPESSADEEAPLNPAEGEGEQSPGTEGLEYYSVETARRTGQWHLPREAPKEGSGHGAHRSASFSCENASGLPRERNASADRGGVDGTPRGRRDSGERQVP